MLWSDRPAAEVVGEGGFPLWRAATWRLHALAPASRPPSQSFYASKVTPRAQAGGKADRQSR